MNAIYSNIFNLLFPSIIQAIEGLLQHAKEHAAAGNPDAAHQALAAAAGLGQVAVQIGAGIIPQAAGVQASPPAAPTPPV